MFLGCFASLVTCTGEGQGYSPILYPNLVSLSLYSLFPKRDRAQGLWQDLAMPNGLHVVHSCWGGSCPLWPFTKLHSTAYKHLAEPSDLADSVRMHYLCLFHEKYLLFTFIFS